MNISLCMIARNEEWCIARCLESVKGVVSQTIVVDTGSTDSTCQIAAEHGATVLHRPWDDDFAAPRNLAAEQVKDGWILALDADEVLPERSGRLVRFAVEHAADVVAWDLPLLNAVSTTLDPDAVVAKRTGIPTPVQRLVKAGTRWKHRIHELPDIHGPVGRLNAPIVHYGYAIEAPKVAQKTDRNLRILTAEHEADPTDVYTAGFLTGEHLAMYERQFLAWANGGPDPDRTLLQKSAGVVNRVLPHLQRNADSYRVVANWGLLALDLGDADEVDAAAETGEKILPGHPDWAYLRGVAHYYRMLQGTGDARTKARAGARREGREAMRRLRGLKAAVVLVSSAEKVETLLERVNRPPEVTAEV